jgi:hypothetical protein
MTSEEEEPLAEFSTEEHLQQVNILNNHYGALKPRKVRFIPKMNYKN